MLKIKDNIDLKELEKYGFKKDEIKGNYVMTVAKDWTFRNDILT